MPTPSRTELLSKALACCEEDNNEGICLACGAIQAQVEPDARKYTCDECNEDKVYGAEEVILLLS